MMDFGASFQASGYRINSEKKMDFTNPRLDSGSGIISTEYAPNSNWKNLPKQWWEVSFPETGDKYNFTTMVIMKMGDRDDVDNLSRIIKAV